MATTTARNKNDVDNMSARDRLYDSLAYSYGKKREESDKSFAKAYSQAVNQGLKTGMQRSSYGAQTLANINKQQIDAQNDIADALIADYENRVYQLERDELEDAWKQKEFDEKQRQYNESLAFQKSEADRSQSNWEKEFAETLVQNQFNRDYMQDEFKYKYGLAGGGSSSGGSSSGGGGGNGGNTSTPNGGDPDRFNVSTVAATAGAIDAASLFGNALSSGVSNANTKNYSELSKKQSSNTKKIGGVASTISSGKTTTSVAKTGKDKLNKVK